MSKRKGDPGYAPGWCIHYRSPQYGPTCEAGISYDSFAKEDRVMTRCPCFIKPDEKPSDRAYCHKLRPPTKQEIEAHNGWVRKRTENTIKVLAHIAPWRKNHCNQGFAEIIVCPICKGKLHLSITRNGHVHGKCTTEDCVSWME